MTPGHKPKVYRLQGVPSDLQDADEVSWYLTERCPDLSGHKIQICSLAKGLTLAAPLPRVATVMFHPRNPGDDSVDCALGGDPVEIISKAKCGLVIDDHFLGMTPFNDVGLDDHEYDCIAVSGIGSHPFGSWMPHDGDKQFMWIRDILPNAFPSARVMIYGYDTELCDTNSYQQIKDLAITFIDHLRAVFRSSATRRSIVLVAHSLGGIVVKQALVMLAESSYSEEKALLKTISGAIYFGVPNHGMVISHLLALASGQPNNRMIEDIKENSPFLARLETKFVRLSHTGEPLSEKSFFWGYETQRSVIPVRNPADGRWTPRLANAPRLKLVECESATRGLWKDPGKHHLVFQINKDHSSMVKFVNAHDPNLAAVIGKFSDLFDCRLPDKFDILTTRTRLDLGMLPCTPSSTDIYATTPSPPTTESFRDYAKRFQLSSESDNLPKTYPFYGRRTELATLSRLLDGPPTNGRLTVSVYGAPGIGKTQLVAQYVEKNRDTYDNVFYIDGSNLDRIRLTLRGEASRIKQSWFQFLSGLRSAGTHSANIDRFCSFLNSEGNTKWLLVIDEMQDSPWIVSIFDQLKQGTAILVSTSSQFTGRFPAVKVTSLDLDASDQLLLGLGPDTIEKTNRREMLLRLDCHPVLIRLATPKLLGFKTLSIFLHHWRDGGIKLPPMMLSRLESIMKIEDDVSLCASQMNILNICLPFDYKRISYDFLEYIGISNLDTFFGNTVEALARHGLIERTRSDQQCVTCSFSELLYQFLRQSVTSWEHVIHKASHLLAQKVPRSYKDNYRERIELLAPHAVMLSSHLQAAQKPISESAESLENLERIASLLRLLDKDAEAITLYSLIHQINAKSSTSMRLTPLRMAEVYNNMGLSCMNDGDMKLASSCFNKAASTLPQEESPETRLWIVANTARALMEMEEHSAAASLLSTNLEQYRSWDKVLLLPLKHALGFAHVQLGRSDLGVPLLEECRSVSESEQLSIGKRVTFTIMHDLATAWRDQKKWDDAISLYEKTREVRESFHGPTHRYTVETTGALAVAYQGSGQGDKAATCFKKALRWQREKLRLNHPDTLQTLQNYGIFLSATGDSDGAKKALHLAHAGWVSENEKNKKTTWNRINSGMSLALVLQKLMDFMTAEKLYDTALTWYREQQENRTPRIAYQHSKTAYLSGEMYETIKQKDLAHARYKEAKEVFIDDNGEASYWKHRAVRAMHNLNPPVRTESDEQSIAKRSRKAGPGPGSQV